MYKKLISSILVVALLNLLGCFSFETVTVETVTVAEYKQIEEIDKPDEIRVITKDSEEYHFSESNFYVENDTLYGKEILLSGDKEELLDRKIALSDIESIELESINAGTPALYVLGGVGLALLIAGLIALAVNPPSCKKIGD